MRFDGAIIEVRSLCADQLRRQLVMLVFGELKDHDFLSMATQSDKFRAPAALNLIETIAHVARDVPSDHLPDNARR